MRRSETDAFAELALFLVYFVPHNPQPPRVKKN